MMHPNANIIQHFLSQTSHTINAGCSPISAMAADVFCMLEKPFLFLVINLGSSIKTELFDISIGRFDWALICILIELFTLTSLQAKFHSQGTEL